MSPQSCGRDVETGSQISTSLCDFHEDLGLLCTDEDDNDEFNEVYGPLCWQGCDNDQGGFKNLMRHGIMKEFNCKATLSWSSCGHERGMIFTYRKIGNEVEGRTAQLDDIVGPRRKSDEAHMQHDVATWDSWDHYPIYAILQEMRLTFSSLRGGERRNGQDGGQKVMRQEID